MFNININNKYIKLAIASLFILAFLILVLTFSQKNNEQIIIHKMANDIIDINDNLDDAIIDDSLNTDKACNILNNNIDSLSKIQNKIKSVDFKDNNCISLRNSLLDYINKNTLLYNSSLSILTSNDFNNYSILYDNLISSEKSILEISKEMNNSELKLYFPKSAQKFFICLNKHVNNAYEKNRDRGFLNSQKYTFLNNTNKILSEFSSLKEDLKPALDKIHEDNRDLNVLIDDLNKKRSKYEEIKNFAYSISIPSDESNYSSLISDVFSSYESYLNSFENNITSELVGNTSSVDYDDVFDKYNNFLNYLDNFKSEIDTYKND